MISLSISSRSLAPRPVRTSSEMLEYSRVRAIGYSNIPGLQRLSSIDSATGLDLDAFDARSTHLVLVSHEPSRERVVGTMRITHEEASPQLGLLHEAFAASPMLLSRLAHVPPPPRTPACLCCITFGSRGR